MNIDKLRQAEANFLQRYPGGFSDLAMQSVLKKHNLGKLSSFSRENLSRASFNRPEHIADTVLKIVSRSSMVSRFEKPRFKDFLASMNSDEKCAFAAAFEKRLHGRKQQGFEEMLGMLQHHKLAKWALISAVPFYYAPEREAFVKPTTAKGIVTFLEVEELQYRPTPSWAFYKGYRDLIKEVKSLVVPTLSPNYAALTGFLMMSL